MNSSFFTLGIDTGGTYTDAVIYNRENDTILAAAKARTNHSDLRIGILEAIRSLDFNLSDINNISLSTTLATNACVEGHVAPAALLIAGGDPAVVAAHGAEYGLTRAVDICFTDAKVTLNGAVERMPNLTEVRKLVKPFCKKRIPIAISGVLSNRNAAVEYAIRDEILSLGGECVCSCDVAPDELNFLTRASASLLNAGLVPFITDFLKSITSSFEELGITAPISIVRSDGTLMSSAHAMRYPVDTILSGPVASISGAIRLSGKNDAVILDIGGTTADMAEIRDGEITVNSKGITVGNWHTAICAADIATFALGGDTRVIIDKNGTIALSENRAIPLCVLAKEYPQIIHELARLAAIPYKNKNRTYEFLMLNHKESDSNIYKEEKSRKIIDLLKKGPLSIDALATKLGEDIYTLRFGELETSGAVIRAGFTLTDVMHIRGEFDRFDRDASLLGAKYFTELCDITTDELCDIAYKLAIRRAYRRIVRHQLKGTVWAEGGELDTIIGLSLDGSEGHLSAIFKSKPGVALIGVGAPARVFTNRIADMLGMEGVVPEHAEVANAVGAAICSIAVSRTVTVKPTYDVDDEYTLLGGTENGSFGELHFAIAAAKKQAHQLAAADAAARGLTGTLEFETTTEDQKSYAVTAAGRLEIYLGTKVTVTAKAAVKE